MSSSQLTNSKLFQRGRIQPPTSIIVYQSVDLQFTSAASIVSNPPRLRRRWGLAQKFPAKGRAQAGEEPRVSAGGMVLPQLLDGLFHGKS